MKLRWRVLLLFAALLGWSAFSLIAAFAGLWLQPVAERGDVEGFTRWATQTLHAEHAGTHAFMLIENGELLAEDYGGPVTVDADTLFPTASFSKWLAALTVMTLVEQGVIGLDAPVQPLLTRWQLPDSEFDLNGVTVRRLLSHTAGLTDGLGFGDYLPDESIPALEDSLAAPRASSGDARIAVGLAPGSEFKYSGGGYLLLELLVEEVTGQPYTDVAQRAVLTPLGMTRSHFVDDVERDNRSPLYAPDGSVAPDYRYASNAATGFSSSAADLLKLAFAVLEPESSVLSADTLSTMRSPEAYLYGAGIWGLGTMLYANPGNADVIFGHDGANDPALNTAVRLSATDGSGVIILVSGTPGLASRIGSQWVFWKAGIPDAFALDSVLASAVRPWLTGCGVVLALFLFSLWRHRGRKTGA